MRVHQGISALPVFKHAVITIGTFDGVHTGHQQIIRLLKEEAQRIQGETVIITFHPHPRTIIQRATPMQLLNTPEEKVDLLEKANIDHLVIVPFDEAFANLSAQTYVEQFLVKTFHPHTIIIGHDHRFGKDRQGNYALLKKQSRQFHYEVKEIPAHMLENIAISSTKIRKALLNGDITTAKHCLGYDYFFSGRVVKGNQLGRTIGYPTANIAIADTEKLVPANGVYAVEVSSQLFARRLPGMMNIGVRPTINGSQRTIEVHLLNINQDLYDTTLTVFVKKYLREELKFPGLEALEVQLDKDKEATLQFFHTSSPS